MKPLPRQQLATVIADLSLQPKQDLDKLAKAVAAYLLENHQLNQLESLLRDVQKNWANKGFVDIQARVARPLHSDIYQDLAQPFKALYPQAKQVKVAPIIDNRVIGGANLELADQRLDITIARRLRRFKKVIKVKGN